MSKKVERWLRQRKDESERAIEPFSLSENPMLKEGKLAGFIVLPLLIGLFALLYIGQTYYVTETEFTVIAGSILGMWFTILIVVFAWAHYSASKYFLFDREFGYTERLHPRCEVYCKPEDIRLLMSPEDELEKPEEFKKRLQEFGFQEKIITRILELIEGDGNCKKMFMYYFRQKGYFQGWNKDRHEIPYFQSHIVFQPKPFEEQYVFGAGQENWFGPIMYNHPHAESDNVKVIAWALDPFTNEPMPLCLLMHSSIVYTPDLKTELDAEIDEKEALVMLVSRQHGVIESFRKKVAHLNVLKDSKFHDITDIITYGRQIAKADRKLEEEIMSPIHGIWAKTWFKGLVTIVAIIAILILILFFTGYLDPILSAIWGQEEQIPQTTEAVLGFFLRR